MDGRYYTTPSLIIIWYQHILLCFILCLQHIAGCNIGLHYYYKNMLKKTFVIVGSIKTPTETRVYMYETGHSAQVHNNKKV